jgi:hypothetical protein
MVAIVVMLLGMVLTFVFMPRMGDGDDDYDYGDYGSPGAAEPDWWPTFEAQFRAYARAVARDVPRRPRDGDSA